MEKALIILSLLQLAQVILSTVIINNKEKEIEELKKQLEEELGIGE